jgi:hypothetical protein
MSISPGRAYASVATLPAFRRARAAADVQQVLALGRALIERDPSNVAVLRAVARLQTETDMKAQALQSWAVIHRAEPGDMEAAYKLARARVETGEGVDAATAAVLPGAGEIARDYLARALGAGPQPSLPDGTFRHVAICGASFCGSTLLDRVLGGLPDTRSIGESHWLTKEHDGVGYVPMDLHSVRTGKGPFCTVCNRNCEVLTPEFRVALTIDPSRWYAKIACRLKTVNLVSADKNLPKLLDHDPLLRFTALVLFKSPLQAWASNLSKMPPGSSPRFYQAALEKYAQTWRAAYESFLDGFQPKGGVVYLSFDEFTDDPESGLAALTSALGLPHDPEVLVRTRPGHAIGGNARAMGRLRAADYGVDISKLPTPEVPKAHAEWLEACAPVQGVYQALMRRRLAF